MSLSPPPRPPLLQDKGAQDYLQSVHRWLIDIWRKTGQASNTAPISVSGTASTITQNLPPTQLAGPIPVDLGGTGATDAASAAANLGVQSAFSPGASGDVPISNGTAYTTRPLSYRDISGVPQIEHKFGVVLTAPGSAALGDSGDTNITWDSSFSDGNYSLSAVSHPTTGTPIVTIVSKISSGCIVRVTNATAVQVTGTLDVQGIHS